MSPHENLNAQAAPSVPLNPAQIEESVCYALMVAQQVQSKAILDECVKGSKAQKGLSEAVGRLKSTTETLAIALNLLSGLQRAQNQPAPKLAAVPNPS